MRSCGVFLRLAGCLCPQNHGWLALKETIGISHNVLGELLAERWKMPPSIRSAIRYAHVGLNEGKPDPLVATVHIAAITAQMFGMGYSGEDFVPEPNPACMGSAPVERRRIFTFATADYTGLRRHTVVYAVVELPAELPARQHRLPTNGRVKFCGYHTVFAKKTDCKNY